MIKRHVRPKSAGAYLIFVDKNFRRQGGTRPVPLTVIDVFSVPGVESEGENTRTVTALKGLAHKLRPILGVHENKRQVSNFDRNKCFVTRCEFLTVLETYLTSKVVLPYNWWQIAWHLMILLS